MRAVLQRVVRAAVRVDDGDGRGPQVVGEITRPGLLVLVGATHDDGPEQVATVARKIAELRLFDGPASEGERGNEVSVTDLGAPVLVVSQFTLYADVRKGRRPSWNAAAPGEVAEPLVEAVAADLRSRGLEVATGRFGAHMLIDMEADGPVTILVEA
ncbi:D-aminoacyl-tRNA deacylase [Actinomyces haliotis]|uniref:D-aminoacyl-tRNA deacylase n=1 Tax=Actinomyces haliotis TaxID=1280843 RepID=UPI00188EDBDC|nr:D-aminoacyl-tRNA deacylase [Actinomyces haliotis]